MATTILAGNATSGLALTPDNTGILELKTGTGAGTTALTLNASQNATLAGTLTVGSTLQVAGVTTNMYPIVSGTVNAGGTNPFPISAGPATVDFTGIPSWVKRITIMFSGVSVSSTSYLLVQIGSGSVDATNYVSYASRSGNSGTTLGQTSTAGFIADTGGGGGNISYGTMTLTNISANVWVESHTLGINAGANFAGSGGGTKTLSGTLNLVRITTVSGTDLFDLGSINILYE